MGLWVVLGQARPFRGGPNWQSLEKALLYQSPGGYSVPFRSILGKMGGYLRGSRWETSGPEVVKIRPQIFTLLTALSSAHD